MSQLRLLGIASLLIGSALLVQTRNSEAGTRLPRTVTTGPCRPMDAVTIEHLHYLRISSIGTTSADSAWRAGTHVPVVTDTLNDIVAVSDSSLCVAALNAYNSLITSDSSATEIELLRADTVFVAGHPSIRSGEFVASHAFDSAFRYLGSYLQ